jgi:hypothetical protein
MKKFVTICGDIWTYVKKGQGGRRVANMNISVRFSPLVSYFSEASRSLNQVWLSKVFGKSMFKKQRRAKFWYTFKNILMLVRLALQKRKCDLTWGLGRWEISWITSSLPLLWNLTKFFSTSKQRNSYQQTILSYK